MSLKVKRNYPLALLLVAILLFLSLVMGSQPITAYSMELGSQPIEEAGVISLSAVTELVQWTGFLSNSIRNSDLSFTDIGIQ